MTPTTRQSAEERREAVLDAAAEAFARGGLHGTSTEDIARTAGISQPYLFRLFGSKKELFLAVNEACFARTLETFRTAASGRSGNDALRAIVSSLAPLIEPAADDPSLAPLRAMRLKIYDHLRDDAKRRAVPMLGG